MTDPHRSQHPIDILIRQTVAGIHHATDSDVEQIIERIAAAPFDPTIMGVPEWGRELTYLGRSLGREEPTVVVHLVKRVHVEEQWVEGATTERYVGDLQRAARTPHARLVLYGRRGGTLAAVLTDTATVLTVDQRGPEWRETLIVVYSADRGIIVTGYQASGLHTISIPEDATWLR